MSRLNHVSDYELAIECILEEVKVLERHLASGGHLTPQDVINLMEARERLEPIAKGSSKHNWESDNEALPAWLQPRTQKDMTSDDVHKVTPGVRSARG